MSKPVVITAAVIAAVIVGVLIGRTTAPVAAMLAEGAPDNLLVLLSGRLTWPAVAMLLDQRARVNGMTEFCAENGISLLAFGVLAGVASGKRTTYEDDLFE